MNRVIISHVRNLKLTISYDGTDFHGWQIQPGQPTIQGALRDALCQITQEEITVHGAGRTDAGVHAWGQVANFMSRSQLTPREFMRALNALLPPAIRVRDAEEVAPEFHARWSACAKTYGFRIYRGEVVPPFLWRYVLHYPFPLDFAAMNEAACHFQGQHDFTSFAASSGSAEIDQERNTLRSVYRSELLPSVDGLDGDMPVGLLSAAGNNAANGAPKQGPDREEWVYLVRAPSFLRNMVRKIMGTLLEVGRGRLAPRDVSRILALRDPACSGPTAPPQGLCLLSVEYPAAIGVTPSASLADS